MAMDKQRLRVLIRERLKALSPDHLRAASENIARQLLSSPLYRNARSLFSYLSLPTEPSTDRIIRQAFADGKQVCVPRCAGGRMYAVPIRDLTRLRPGAYGIPEPIDCAETIDAAGLDLIVVPCVAASLNGRRLGHGAGYYDRFLAGGHPNAVCLCFRQLLCDDIPMTDNDVPIPWVITERVEAS